MIQWKRICCAVQLPDVPHAAISTAMELAQRFDAHLTFLHVDQLPGYTLPDGPAFATAATLNRHRLAIEAMLSELAKTARQSGVHDVETVNNLGEPATEIVRFADLGGFDLLVIGTHGRTGLRHALLGSVCEKVVRRANCPVLVAHEQADVSRATAH